MAARLLLLLLDARLTAAACSASIQPESAFLCFRASLLPHQCFKVNTV